MKMFFNWAVLFLMFVVSEVTPNPSCPSLEPGMINVHLVCHTHDDVGWLKTVDQYYYGSRKDITWVGVQYILDSVVPALLQNPSRKFIFVESAFFYRWWDEQNDQMKSQVQSLVDNGQLEFINGGWCMNDEAAAHYNDIIDQMTIGLAQLNRTFGAAAIPRIAWQIDPFGHSKEQASLFAQMGLDGLFFGRLDHFDKDNRWVKNELEMVWEASNSLGEDAWIFTGVLPNGYSPPSGFCFDLLCHDDPIMDDPALEDYNKDFMVDKFLLAVDEQNLAYKTSNLIMTMGDDFNYVYADSWFKNLDKLIKYVNMRQASGSNVNVVYSTPSCYLDALHSANQTWPTKTDDFFPYSSDDHCYWTGYFTSRPTLKGFIRLSNNILQAVKQISALAGTGRGNGLDLLAKALAVAQHHDAVTGTAKQHVTDDYSKRLAAGVAAANAEFITASRILTESESDLSATFANQYCPYLNISSCPFTESESSFIVSVYNPIGRPISYYVRVPVTEDLNYNVTDGEGNPVEIQIVPIPAAVENAPGRTSTAKYELVFYADNLPALGTEQFLVQNTTAVPTTTRRSKKLLRHSNKETVITKGNLRLTLDKSNMLKSVGSALNDISADINMTQNFLWYAAMAGDNRNDASRPSGAYIFRPNGTANEFTTTIWNTAIYEGPLVTEIQQEWSSWVTQVLRMYNNENYIEMEWLVGPIPVDDGIGKEIINRVTLTDMQTSSTFYTDANGREMQTRIKNFRETWKFVSTEPISQNYYPVNSRIILSSTNDKGQAALLNDRAQGGTSLDDGEMELMVHRRLLYDDAKGVGEALNEVAYGEGLVVRGSHYFIHSDLDTPDCDFVCQHRTLGEKLLLLPVLTFSSAPVNVPSWRSNVKAKVSGLSTPLPANIHLLTLEPWDNGKWLLRLENFYEVNENANYSVTVSIDIENMFADWTVTDIAEVTLGANQLLQDNVKLQWQTEAASNSKISPSFNSSPEDVPAAEYSFAPMQIRSFILTVSKN